MSKLTGKLDENCQYFECLHRTSLFEYLSPESTAPELKNRLAVYLVKKSGEASVQSTACIWLWK
jgi:hypothetical protein